MKDQRDELRNAERRIDDLIAEAEHNITSLLAVVEEMKRQNAAQKQITEDERSGRS